MRGVAVSACGAAQPSMLRPNTCRITLAPRMTGGGRHRRSPLLIISTATAPAADSSCPLSAEQDRGVQAKIADQATLKRQSLANRVADALADKALLVLAANKMADKLPGVEVPFNPSYTEVVDVTREVVKGRSPREQQQFVSEALLGLFPSYARAVLRTVWPCAQWSAELDAQITQVYRIISLLCTVWDVIMIYDSVHAFIFMAVPCGSDMENLLTRAPMRRVSSGWLGIWKFRQQRLSLMAKNKCGTARSRS